MNEKEIAKEILIKAMDGYIVRDEFPNAETAIDVLCEAYIKILKAVKEG